MAAGTEGGQPLHAVLGWEHRHREMFPALLWLHEAQRRGLAASLAHVEALPAPAAPELLYLPFYYDDHDRDRYLASGWRGRALVNLCYEQLHMPCARGYLMPDGVLARDHMIHCAWGPRFAGLLRDHGIPAERIVTTGAMRLDIYHHRSLLWSRETLAEAFGLDAQRPWVLLPHNFNLAYVSERQVQSLVRRKYLLEPEMIEAVAQARDGYAALAGELARSFPEVEFILRVHPAGYERPGAMRLPTDCANVHIINAWDVANWIVQAALVVVWTSTSAVEAMAAGVPVVGFEPVPFSQRWGYEVNRIIPTVATIAEVQAVVASLPAPALRYDWDLFADWYGRNDGGAVGRVLDIATSAAGAFDAVACRAPAPPWPSRARRWWRRWTGKPRHGEAAPPPDALAAAAARLDPAPLGDYLR